jgi:hypothetical protein
MTLVEKTSCLGVRSKERKESRYRYSTHSVEVRGEEVNPAVELAHDGSYNHGRPR